MIKHKILFFTLYPINEFVRLIVGEHNLNHKSKQYDIVTLTFRKWNQDHSFSQSIRLGSVFDCNEVVEFLTNTIQND
jgi:hypothetical protein